jgi:hypothetical protein
MIEIRQPELEALIMARLQAPASAALTTADILAAFQRSPFKERDIEPKSTVSTISSPVEF